MTQISNSCPWFHDEAHFNECVKLFTDDHIPEYSVWLKLAEEGCASVEKAGLGKVERVEIDPANFLQWCASEGYEPDGRGRQVYAMTFSKHAHN